MRIFIAILPFFPSLSPSPLHYSIFWFLFYIILYDYVYTLFCNYNLSLLRAPYAKNLFTYLFYFTHGPYSAQELVVMQLFKEQEKRIVLFDLSGNVILDLKHFLVKWSKGTIFLFPTIPGSETIVLS